MSDDKKEKETIPLKEVVPFEIFQQMFEKLMENADKQQEDGTDWLFRADKRS